MGHTKRDMLSAYVDGEVDSRQARAIEAHLADCAACRANLEGMRNLVSELRRVERVAPPAVLAERVRRQAPVAAGVPLGFRRRLGTLFFDLPRPALATPLTALAALVVSLVLLDLGPARHGAPRPSAHAPRFKVVESFGDEGLGVPPQTTSQVAGRVFVFTDNGWVQSGVEGSEPQTRIAVHSPQGRQILAELSDLNFLLADGSRVVLRHNLETLELTNGGAVPTGLAAPRS